MSDSLRDQLLKAGLVTKSQASRVEIDQQRKQHRQKKGGGKAESPEALAKRQKAAAAQAAKAARDRELNQARQEKAAARARAAEIRQLVDQHRLPALEGENLEYFNFVTFRKIRRIAVNDERREKLRKGELFIVWYEGRTAMVPADVAAKIRERDEKAVIAYQEGPEEVDENDPYKDYVVPDDLKW
jgi:uncharacterized protein YaiL (DUF2058 family)